MSVFKELKKDITLLLKSKGFSVSGRHFYYTLNDIAYCISFDELGMLYSTVYIIPLYIPTKNRYYSYGNRLNNILGSTLSPLPTTCNDKDKKEWFWSFCQHLENIVLPFFAQIETPEKLASYIEQKSYARMKMFVCPDVFIEQLKVYTYLYLRNFQKLTSAIHNYRSMLQHSNFLTLSAREIYSNDLDTIITLLEEEKEEAIMNFQKIVINNTKKLL